MYTAFTNIMIELRDSFMRELDKETTGLKGLIDYFQLVLNAHNRELFELIEDCELPH